MAFAVQEHPLIMPRSDEPEPQQPGAAAGGAQALKPSRARQSAAVARGGAKEVKTEGAEVAGVAEGSKDQ